MTSTAENRVRALANPRSNLAALLRERHRFLGDHVRLGDRVLEIGSGIGVTHLAMPECRLVRTDVEANPWIDAVASGETLPFQDGSFDAVVCIAALHHMHHPLAALREMARVLKPGGKALIVEVHASRLLRAMLSATGHEYVDFNVDPFGSESCQSRAGDHWNGNNAVGDLLFGDPGRLRQALPQFSLAHHCFTETVLLVNSGGVNYHAPHIPLPPFMQRWAASLDRLLGRLAPDLFSICQEVVLVRKAG